MLVKQIWGRLAKREPCECRVCGGLLSRALPKASFLPTMVAGTVERSNGCCLLLDWSRLVPSCSEGLMICRRALLISFGYHCGPVPCGGVFKLDAGRPAVSRVFIYELASRHS
jgi:hypothetical protein